MSADHADIRPFRHFDDQRFALAYRLGVRLQGSRHADAQVLAAVTVLTASAAPSRADRIRPRAGESAALVERLAMWALHRATDESVRAAGRILERPIVVDDRADEHGPRTQEAAAPTPDPVVANVA